MIFSKTSPPASPGRRSASFAYLAEDACYMDTACQSLRPQCVIDAEKQYYETYNACGGRVKYAWGQNVDERVADARSRILAYAGKKEKDYAVAFTLNTTYGINLVLHQLPTSTYASVVTSEIEHNSVFVPTMTFAQRRSVPRTVLPRDENGNLLYEKNNLEKSVVIINSMSNIDGRIAQNLQSLATDTHAAGGILLVDAAQGFAHDAARLANVDFDAAFGSGHKMYGPSIGFIVIKRSLLRTLEPFFLGGGTVEDVVENAHTLLRGSEEHAILEPGLQNWGGIIGLGEALRWLEKEDHRDEQEATMARTLFEELSKNTRIHLLNRAPSPILSFHADGIDAHAIALYLSEQNIMCRSGHFCCHSYLKHQRGLPPLVRVSLGLHNTPRDIDRFLTALRAILSAL